jgi:PAS domain S-box-containing protein
MQRDNKTDKKSRQPGAEEPGGSRKKVEFGNHALSQITRSTPWQCKGECSLIIKESEDCIFLVELGTKRIMKSNPALTRLLGFSPGNLFEFEDHDEKSIQNYFSRIARGSEAFHGERRYRKADGSIVIMDVKAVGIVKDGTVLMIARDATERRKLERRKEGEVQLDMISLVLRALAHDMNNNLTTITAGSSCFEWDKAELERRLGPQMYASIMKDIELIALASAKLKEKTERLYGLFDELEPGEKPASVERLVKSYTYAIRRPNLEVSYYIPEETWPIEVVGSQIGRVFENLFHNSIQAMDEREVDGGRISVSAQNIELHAQNKFKLPQGRYVEISISDNAGGIAPDVLAKIFDLGFSTKENGKGIGLAICRLNIQKNGGDLLVESKEGTGTRFEIILPAYSKVPFKERGTTGDYRGL